MTGPHEYLRANYSDMGASYVATGPPATRPPAGPDDHVSALLDLAARPEWHQRAACRAEGAANLHVFFPDRGESAVEAKRICFGCPVRDECEQSTRRHGDRYGIWAGKGERERRRERKAERTGIPAPRSYLTDEQVLTARELYATGRYTFAQLADRYGLHRQAMRRVIVGDAYKHLPGAVPARKQRKK